MGRRRGPAKVSRGFMLDAETNRMLDELSALFGGDSAAIEIAVMTAAKVYKIIPEEVTDVRTEPAKE